MSIQQIIILVALMGYAIYMQSHRHEVIGGSRFKLAIICGIVGVVVGGFAVPAGPWEIGFLIVSLALNVICGVIFPAHHRQRWFRRGHADDRADGCFPGADLWNRAKPLGARQRDSDPVETTAPQQVLQHR